MIESGLVKGVTITFPTGTEFEAEKSIDNPQESNLKIQNLTLTLSSSKYSTTSNITYLPYAGGRINYARTTGDVLSGFFTGCIMSVYLKNGYRTVSHVHTGADSGPRSDCKALMRNRLNSTEYTSLKNFKPFIEDKFMTIYKDKKFHNPKHLKVLGLVSHDNRCYSVFVSRVSDLVWRVEGRFDRTTYPYVYV